jgi:hypothetical protein
MPEVRHGPRRLSAALGTVQPRSVATEPALAYAVRPAAARALPVPLKLYRRESCSLCDFAEVALQDANVGTYATEEVGWQGDLAERYGWRVPVLCDVASGRELDWPFDAWSVRAFLAMPGSAGR